MTFEKAKFPIYATSKGERYARFVSGYKFEAFTGEIPFFEMGVYKDDCPGSIYPWTVTDLNTGMAVCIAKTRKEAVEVFQRRYASRLKRMILDNKHWSSDIACYENTYEKLSREFGELLKAAQDAQ